MHGLLSSTPLTHCIIIAEAAATQPGDCPCNTEDSHRHLAREALHVTATMASMDADSIKAQMDPITMMRSPSADRNKEPILTVLRQLVGEKDAVAALEIASGNALYMHIYMYFSNKESKVT